MTAKKTNGNGAATETVEQVMSATQDAWKEGFDRAIKGYDELNAQSKENVDALVESLNASVKGFEKLNEEAISYSKKAVEDSIATAQAASAVKNVQELIELNTGFTKSVLEAYIGTATKMSELFTATAKDAAAPINARVSKTVEAVQAGATK